MADVKKRPAKKRAKASTNTDDVEQHPSGEQVVPDRLARHLMTLDRTTEVRLCVRFTHDAVDVPDEEDTVLITRDEGGPVPAGSCLWHPTAGELLDWWRDALLQRRAIEDEKNIHRRSPSLFLFCSDEDDFVIESLCVIPSTPLRVHARTTVDLKAKLKAMSGGKCRLLKNAPPKQAHADEVAEYRRQLIIKVWEEEEDEERNRVIGWPPNFVFTSLPLVPSVWRKIADAVLAPVIDRQKRMRAFCRRVLQNHFEPSTTPAWVDRKAFEKCMMQKIAGMVERAIQDGETHVDLSTLMCPFVSSRMDPFAGNAASIDETVYDISTLAQ